MDIDLESIAVIAFALLICIVFVGLPIWVALGFIVWAVRQKRFGISFLLAWTLAEAVSLAIALGAISLIEALPKV